MSATLHQDLLARLRATLTPIYDGEAEAPSTLTEAEVARGARYAVLHMDVGTISSDDVANTQRLLRAFPVVTCVGTTPQQALWVASRVRDALAGWTPTVDGWAFGPLGQTTAGRAERDDDVRPPVYSIPVTFVAYGSR